MKSMDAFADALRSLRTNTMRSVLTTLGIIIGVSAVIVMVSVGNGAKDEINKMIDSLGANLMMVVPGGAFGRGVSAGARSPRKLGTAQLARRVGKTGLSSTYGIRMGSDGASPLSNLLWVWL